MTLRRLQTLLEAKNIGGHAKAHSPWRNHALVATVTGALRPGRYQALQDVGQRFVYPDFARLEAQFRRELKQLLDNVSGPDDATNHKAKRIFRVYYTQAFKLGLKAAKGGKLSGSVQLGVEDKRWLETFLRKEFEFWKKFMGAVRTQATKLDPSQRLEMYVQTFKSMYNTARVLATPLTALYYWETTPAEHCPHCLYLALKSPFIKENIPTLPASGDTVCKSNCRCHLRIAHSSVAAYMKVKKTAPTRQELLRGMRSFRG